MALVYTFGAGFLAIGVICVALALTLDPADRRKALAFVRHPVVNIFGPHDDEPVDEG